MYSRRCRHESARQPARVAAVPANASDDPIVGAGIQSGRASSSAATPAVATRTVTDHGRHARPSARFGFDLED